MPYKKNVFLLKINHIMIKLSVLIITYNEEANIGRCLDSVQAIADEIVIIDSQSTDKTEEICLSKGAKVIQKPFENFVKQRNNANEAASNDYILTIDADEVLTPELIQSIKAIKENWQYDVYEVNRLNNYCGQWIKHSGWYPEWRPRIFNRQKVNWVGLLVHETLEVDTSAKTSRVDGHLLHYSYKSVSEHIQRINRYSDLTAQESFIRKKSSNLFKIWFNPKLRFFRDYIVKGGFRDGYYGYVICKVSALTTFLKYSKLKDLYAQEKLNNLNK